MFLLKSRQRDLYLECNQFQVAQKGIQSQEDGVWWAQRVFILLAPIYDHGDGARMKEKSSFDSTTKTVCARTMVQPPKYSLHGDVWLVQIISISGSTEKRARDHLVRAHHRTSIRLVLVWVQTHWTGRFLPVHAKLGNKNAFQCCDVHQKQKFISPLTSRMCKGTRHTAFREAYESKSDEEKKKAPYT